MLVIESVRGHVGYHQPTQYVKTPPKISVMNETPEARKLDIICKCSGTRKSQIIRLMDAGVTSVEAISSATGACSGCGACDSDILDLMAEHSRLHPYAADSEPRA